MWTGTLWADFINAIEQGKRPTCDIEIGHHSTTLSLLGMLSWNLGRSVKWDGEKEECPGDAEANALLRRDYRAPWKYPNVWSVPAKWRATIPLSCDSHISLGESHHRETACAVGLLSTSFANVACPTKDNHDEFLPVLSPRLH